MKIALLDNFIKRNRGITTGVYVSEDGSLCAGYTSLAKCPEVMTACYRIAELIGSITIHLMRNTPQGDVREVNELSRIIDIKPMPNMTRKAWMEAVVMNLLLYGHGNSVVVPHTYRGYLASLEPISASRVVFNPVPGSYRDYTINIDGIDRSPEGILHFVFNPNKLYMWKGDGVNVSLRTIAGALEQERKTEFSFMNDPKPSLILKVDGFTDELATKEGREKLYEEYVKNSEAGIPWILPADQLDVESIKPLTLEDLAISDSVKLNKQTIASIIGVPPFLLGVGQYNREEWNTFVQTKIRSICITLAQEMTKKLIYSPDLYFRFNILSLMDWDIETIASVFNSLSDRGFVTGNEVRERIGMSPSDAEGLDEYRVLENYIPYDMAGLQKKLVQNSEE